MMLWMLLACANDCEQTCTDAGRRISRCMGGWSADWEDVGADDRSDFEDQCVAEWETAFADLEQREVEVALDQCSVAVTQLRQMSCDELRALYVDP
jgi:hypothetical protein